MSVSGKGPFAGEQMESVHMFILSAYEMAVFFILEMTDCYPVCLQIRKSLAPNTTASFPYYIRMMIKYYYSS